MSGKGILDSADSRKNEIVSFVQELVRIDSAGKNETEVNSIVKGKLDEYGIKSKLVGKLKGRKNLVGGIKGNGKKSILLCGHADTVPFGDIKKWRHHPLSGKLAGGKIYGRGAADMKGGVASLVFSMIAIRESGVELGGDVKLLVTQNEENGLSGIREMAGKIDANACIVAEPNRSRHPEYKLSIGSRGVFRAELVTKGKSAHSGSLHERGINAVSKMTRIIIALERMRFRYRRHPLFPPPRIMPTMIKGGVAVNIVPDECRAFVDCRLSYGQNNKTVLEDIKRAVDGIRDRELDWRMNELTYIPPSLCSKDSEIVRLLKPNFERILGAQAKVQVSGCASDANLLNNTGIPSVEIGPKGDNMHSENEFVEIRSVVDCAKVFSATVCDFLSHKPSDKI